jgi:hypothetical protein
MTPAQKAALVRIGKSPTNQELVSLTTALALIRAGYAQQVPPPYGAKPTPNGALLILTEAGRAMVGKDLNGVSFTI